MRLPSGDHTGRALSPGPLVRRLLMSRANSNTHISPVPVEFATATRVPSRDRFSSEVCPGVQAVPVAFPCLSYQVRRRYVESPVAYTRVPVSETEYAPKPPKPPIRSAMGTASL